MWWAGLIEISLFLLLAGVVLWVFFKPTKKPKDNNKS
jgi:hypothetical protein